MTRGHRRDCSDTRAASSVDVRPWTWARPTATSNAGSRRRELSRVFEGVYVDHTGPLSAEQRAWAAVLYAAPAALAGKDALHAHGVRGFERSRTTRCIWSWPPIDGSSRSRGSGSHGLTAFDSPGPASPVPAPGPVGSWRPPGRRARSRNEDGAVGVLADVCQTHRTTTPTGCSSVCTTPPRIAHRALLLTVLDDIASGAYSALERRFLVKVERAHGLPTGTRQRRGEDRAPPVLHGRRPTSALTPTSSSTVAWAMTAPSTGGPIWNGTWCQRRRGSSPCGSAGCRSSKLIALLLHSARSSSPMAGSAALARVGPTARSPEKTEDPRHQVPRIFRFVRTADRPP